MEPRLSRLSKVLLKHSKESRISKPTRPLRQQSGVTLVGMAVSLAVAGILLNQAVPAPG